LRKWASQLISALFTCHEQAKVIHRDIKPQNLMLNGENLMLVDFGTSKIFEDDNDTVYDTEGTY
jgi:serine/threonine protein kinase